jgi:hypothetical protein
MNKNCVNISKKDKDANKDSDAKGIICFTFNPMAQHVYNDEEEIDKDYFRGGSRLARVYKVHETLNNNIK